MRDTSIKVRWKPMIVMVGISFLLLLSVLRMVSKTPDDFPFDEGDEKAWEGFKKNVEEGASKKNMKGGASKKTNDQRQKDQNAEVKYVNWLEPNGKFNPGDPGEDGKPVILKDDEKIAMEESYAKFGFNQFVSDKISLHRSLADVRPKECASKKYQEMLPKVSVIIIFHNEGWSTLLRTVHSVLNRSPPELLHQIVLCDDASTKDHLKEKLEKYVDAQPKVKLVRTKQREGLIRARVYGADHSDGEVLLFLDSHCEANIGWLPPLLSEIAKDYRNVVCPTVDFIDHKDFHYNGVDPYIRGTFDWRFDYKEKGITNKMRAKRKDTTVGVRSPVMAGGLFAISRKFWEELGKYDPDMYVWGGEQFELSFKLWMCGGQMMNMPCSRVGHVYRRNVPYSYNKPHAVLVNFKRVAEVWMDEFRDMLYHFRSDIKSQKTGPIFERVELRERLKCKSFKWYLKNVANDTIRTRYEPDRAAGQVKHVDSEMCFAITTFEHPVTVKLTKCEPSRQKFIWTYLYEIRINNEQCLDARFSDLQNIYVERCHLMGGNQKFFYDKETQQFRHSGSGKCISVSKDKTHAILEVCDKDSSNQKWHINTEVPKDIPEWALIAEDLPHFPIPP